MCFSGVKSRNPKTHAKKAPHAMHCKDGLGNLAAMVNSPRLVCLVDDMSGTSRPSLGHEGFALFSPLFSEQIVLQGMSANAPESPRHYFTRRQRPAYLKSAKIWVGVLSE